MVRAVAPLVVLVLAAVSVRPASAAEVKGIKPGDEIVVTIGPAPVKQDDRTVATVKAGTKLIAKEVEASRVKVSVEQEGTTVEGWIPILYVRPETPRPPEKTEPPAPKADETKSTTRLATNASEQLDQALATAIRREAASGGDTDGAIVIYREYALRKYMPIAIGVNAQTVTCLNAGRSLLAKMEAQGMGTMVTGRNIKLGRLDDAKLLCLDAVTLGGSSIPAYSLLCRTGSSWEAVTGPGVLTETLADLKSNLRSPEWRRRLFAVEAVGHLGPAGRELIPGLIAALKDRAKEVAESAQQSLVKLTGEELGRNPAAWQQWWREQAAGKAEERK